MKLGNSLVLTLFFRDLEYGAPSARSGKFLCFYITKHLAVKAHLSRPQVFTEKRRVSTAAFVVKIIMGCEIGSNTSSKIDVL